MIDSNNFLYFVCTVSTVIATVGALIASFATFRLEKIDSEIVLLKGLYLERPVNENGLNLKQYLDFGRYHFVRPIYDHNLESVKLLREQTSLSGGLAYNQAFQDDLENIEQNLLRAIQVKRLNIIGFSYSGFLILFTQSLAVFANKVMSSNFALAISLITLLLLAIGLGIFGIILTTLADS